MPALPAEVLYGIYLGLLVGTIPALVAWILGFSFKYVTGVTLPGFGVMILAVALAGVNGGLLALADPAIIASPNAPSVLTAIVVVSMLSLYAHSKGDAMAADFPRRLTLSQLRSQTISKDLAELVDGGEEVRVPVVGEVADMEGYPPLPEELRAEIRRFDDTFPSDLRLEEIEDRFADRLVTEFDLGDVEVTVDERGRATVVAAPPFSGLSKRVVDGRHAVSVTGLVPTGLARGDEVTLITADAQARGTVISARTEGNPAVEATSDGQADQPDPESVGNAAVTGAAEPPAVRAPTTDGGHGRITVAVNRTDVQPLLRADEVKVVVESRGRRREFEAVSICRRDDRQFRRIAVQNRMSPPAATTGGQTTEQSNGAGGDEPPIDSIGALHAQVDPDVVVLAVRKPDGWQVAPRGRTRLEPGDELIAVGNRTALDTFERQVSA